MIQDEYKTIKKASKETLFKEKGSKFFGYVFPVLSEEDVKIALEELKKKHATARHFCYAYQIGVTTIAYRVNDDGEPKNSAGLPMYQQIQSFGVTNILVVSVRYFGGTKLGVGGLIAAYKKSAQLSLEVCEIVKKTININFELTFSYDSLNSVMRVIKEKNIQIIKQQQELFCVCTISVRKREAKKIVTIFDSLYKITIKKLETQRF